jgi:predicted RNase H-like nuclease
MTWVAGADGCRGGWFVALLDTASISEGYGKVVEHISGIRDLPEKPKIVAIDIPIGLLNEARRGGRECDRIARSMLGHLRARSVFSPPIRGALRHKKYSAALAENRRSSPKNIGISQQCFGLFEKLCQVDEWIHPHNQKQVREVHPELCFYEMDRGRPMRYGKRDPRGRQERRALLYEGGFRGMIETALVQTRRSEVGEDDILDACAACWTAARILNDRANVIPETDDAVDSRGLKMQIWR